MFNVKRLKMLMLEKGLSQKELARKIGVTEASMSRYCRESRCPKSDTVSKMAIVLGTTADYLMGGYAQDTPEGSSGRVIELIRDNKWRWTVSQYKAVYHELTGKELV